MVEQAAQSTKAGSNRQAAVERWQMLLTELAADGTDAALLACTDLNVVSAATRSPLPIVDATQCLAAATVRRWRALAG